MCILEEVPVASGKTVRCPVVAVQAAASKAGSNTAAPAPILRHKAFISVAEEPLGTVIDVVITSPDAVDDARRRAFGDALLRRSAVVRLSSEANPEN